MFNLSMIFPLGPTTQLKTLRSQTYPCLQSHLYNYKEKQSTPLHFNSLKRWFLNKMTLSLYRVSCGAAKKCLPPKSNSFCATTETLIHSFFVSRVQPSNYRRKMLQTSKCLLKKQFYCLNSKDTNSTAWKCTVSLSHASASFLGVRIFQQLTIVYFKARSCGTTKHSPVPVQSAQWMDSTWNQALQ